MSKPGWAWGWPDTTHISALIMAQPWHPQGPAYSEVDGRTTVGGLGTGIEGAHRCQGRVLVSASASHWWSLKQLLAGKSF